MKRTLCQIVQDDTHDAICNFLRRGNFSKSRILDIGCWDGVKTSIYANICRTKSLYGIEIFKNQAKQAKKNGVQVTVQNIENRKFPFKSSSFDIVICNQVFEHLKNIFLPLDEIYRVLKIKGTLIISVPNLASFHNRLLLAFGVQPTAIRIFGPHVRGFTLSEFSKMLRFKQAFDIIEIQGVGFYPFKSKIVRSALCAFFRSAAHTPIWYATKITNKNPMFLKNYLNRREQTNI